MTDIFNKKEFVKKRQYLRKNMTKAEIILWSKLKGKQLKGLKFRRQHGINNYVVDFYCPESRLAIEIDGGVHYYNSRVTYDKQRQEEIEALGIKVLRYTNNDVVKNLEDVLNDIIKTTTPLSPPSQGGDAGKDK
ncbi:MAG: endonuclease domain-containing protein [Candidatus Scalindua sp.]|jgi:very-short-patch-repair endonuclease|nr:endonuclease domain-containing protein [Candidatus Scalindua sp.]MBT5304784.1 endonuclease domain-containing protein [Candidatus Scalindua sp.]MBT6048940.1 endonuclease domain-containing protein [Candidatus Scalindua sp.]MBT6231157.1 endonuclease domain-containing protein [Candidatus Scalindua sp.]MBT6562341.1 endonuclease domain-containing protein [Candidatus Scalindua sp.]